MSSGEYSREAPRRLRRALGRALPGSVGRKIARCQRRPEEFDAPPGPEGVERLPIRNASPHRARKLREEGFGIECRGDEDVLAGWSLCHIDEAMGRATGNAHDITSLGEEPPAVHLVEVASLDDAKDLRLAVSMPRRARTGRVDRLDEAELACARGKGHTDKQIETDGGDPDGGLRAPGMKEGYPHASILTVPLEGR